ncbi:hypothetical protein EVAR_98213_1 [Eumeta japonica]|uniref:Uncharacterized protein n=1 Tax=Eumeta variegata TaxID=151549 RepID=A0A4C1Y5M1_EUMVA|nr:hypothetical protein EVAR_98213_1 [Eumeta japonica]
MLALTRLTAFVSLTSRPLGIRGSVLLGKVRYSSQGRTNLTDGLREGRLSTTTTEYNISAVRLTIETDKSNLPTSKFGHTQISVLGTFMIKFPECSDISTKTSSVCDLPFDCAMFLDCTSSVSTRSYD